MRVPSAKIAQSGAKPVEAPEVVNEAATRVCQAPLFSAAMVSRADFSPAAVFKMVVTMCERGSSTATNAMKTEVQLEPMVDSEEDTVQELLAAAARVKTMPVRPAIERSSISPGVVVVDNFQGIFQLVGRVVCGAGRPPRPPARRIRPIDLRARPIRVKWALTDRPW
jgi:hypothetical protein